MNITLPLPTLELTLTVSFKIKWGKYEKASSNPGVFIINKFILTI